MCISWLLWICFSSSSKFFCLCFFFVSIIFWISFFDSLLLANPPKVVYLFRFFTLLAFVYRSTNWSFFFSVFSLQLYFIASIVISHTNPSWRVSLPKSGAQILFRFGGFSFIRSFLIGKRNSSLLFYIVLFFWYFSPSSLLSFTKHFGHCDSSAILLTKNAYKNSPRKKWNMKKKKKIISDFDFFFLESFQRFDFVYALARLTLISHCCARFTFVWVRFLRRLLPCMSILTDGEKKVKQKIYHRYLCT